MNENPADYFKKYRDSIGFTSQNKAKNFLGGKDIIPGVDFDYIDSLNERLRKILKKINGIADNSYKQLALDKFFEDNVEDPYKIIKENGLLPKLNNQGRRPEAVLFSWLRGYSIAEYFIPAFSIIFDISKDSVKKIGDDDLKNIETFKRSSKADFQIKINDKKVRIEVQSGFQGTNDIKEHKVREARRVYKECGDTSICIHIDLFNGQVAFVRLDTIEENDVNFVTRQQMEGQSVFVIDQNYFKWRLLDPLPLLDKLELSI